MQKAIPLIVYALLFSSLALCQKNERSSILTLPQNEITLENLISFVEEQTSFFVSYTLEEVLRVIEEQLAIQVEIDYTNKKINFYKELNTVIYGIIRDSLTAESLQAVSVLYSDSNGTYSNEDGYYHLTVPSDKDSIHFSYLGYKTASIALPEGNKISLDMDLVSDTRLKTVVIRSDSLQPISLTYDPEIVDLSESHPVVGINGRVDLISNIKSLPGVSVGSEAQNGFTVRGGSPDQNMVLIDGIPIYATSHLGGLSSIFIQNTIKNADLYKGAIPARFGGRLSSILDVRLKDGNRNKASRSISLNLENINGFIEGPIDNKTSVIVNARTSLLNLYIDRLIPESSRFVSPDLKYYDIYSKLSHWFSPSNRLSFTVYSGTDRVVLERQEEQLDLSFIDFNRIGWANNLMALNWNLSLSEKVFFHSHIGSSNFEFSSRSANTVFDFNGLASSLDISTNSSQEDLIASANIDVYFRPKLRFKLGLGTTKHISSASIVEQQTYLEELNSDQDSLYNSFEHFGFLESAISLSKTWKLNTGLRVNSFTGLDTSYNVVQPRVNLQYLENGFALNLSYSRMSQFLHRLVNPSSGLPNDLWVPSTSKVAPEISNLYSLSFAQKNKSWEWGISGFYSTYENLIEYMNANELIQVIVKDHTPFNWDVEAKDWEERITTGTGRAYGAELNLNYRSKKVSFDLAYTLSKSERSFNFGSFSDNTLETFLHKYDRPHNISASFQYRINKNQQINIGWVFGNGNRWTRAKYEEPTFDGESLVVAKSRNNDRLSNYHRLGISYRKTIATLKVGTLEYTFGIYNIYNNKNPFYSFLQEAPPQSVYKYLPKEISLYPIFPQVNFTYTW